MRLIAPLGHTSEHLVHSGRQYPCSNDISGCIKLPSSFEGLKTWLGQAETHGRQPVHFFLKPAIPSEPGGTMSVPRSGCFLTSISAKPPSNFLANAFFAVATANNDEIVKNFLRDSPLFSIALPSGSATAVSCSTLSCSAFSLGFRLLQLLANPINDCGQLSRQLKHATQRE